KEKFLQFLFFKQWFALRNYCNQKQVRFIGDMPIYVSMDSVDVWVHRDLFKLDKDGYPSVVAGVPPDYFSKTGQRWGNPVYNWDALKKTGYDWWIRRIAHSLKLSDIVRIDHFRGFVDFWEIPAGEETAVNGSWAKAPADDFFTTLMNKMPDMPIIAEDLGYLSDDARNAIKKFNLPGMRLMIFAFGEDNPNHPYLPGNFIENCIGYTGTHDNNTIRGWFENEAAAQEKERALKYLKRKTAPKNIAWEFVKCVMASRANTVIMPVQDILGLGREARMNIPSRPEGNWEWRLLPGQVDPAVAKKLFDITKASNRG
ncbi:MAG: 4-alpha-glucanotransferase, partial [Candidatus Omnitrophota bacterium]